MFTLDLNADVAEGAASDAELIPLLTSANLAGGLHAGGPADIRRAADMGYKIKLLGVAQMTPRGLEQRMSPCLVPADSPLGQLMGGTNMVVVEGDSVGQIVLRGAGAGDARCTLLALVRERYAAASDALEAQKRVRAALERRLAEAFPGGWHDQVRPALPATATAGH